MPGRESDCREGQGVKSVDRADAFAVEARSISKSYRSSRRGRRRTTVFRDVSVQVEPGEVVGITGPSGAGKSTLLYCLSGLEPVDSGDVLVQGSDMTHCSQGARAAVRRKCMGFIFQEYDLVDSLTVLGNVELASRMAGMGRQRDAVLSTLERVGMTAFLDAYPDELSGGPAAARRRRARPRAESPRSSSPTSRPALLTHGTRPSSCKDSTSWRSRVLPSWSSPTTRGSPRRPIGASGSIPPGFPWSSDRLASGPLRFAGQANGHRVALTPYPARCGVPHVFGYWLRVVFSVCGAGVRSCWRRGCGAGFIERVVPPGVVQRSRPVAEVARLLGRARHGAGAGVPGNPAGHGHQRHDPLAGPGGRAVPSSGPWIFRAVDLPGRPGQAPAGTTPPTRRR